MQYTRLTLWLFAAGLLGLAACVNPPDYPIEPVIVYEGLNKDTIYQFRDAAGNAGPPDSITIQFSFTDGDGDISTTDTVDIFVRDSRFLEAERPTSFAFPPIPGEGTSNGISGDVFVTVVNSAQGICCIFNDRICIDDPRYPVDTFSYFIYMVDRAGNQSNTIQTEQIKLLCDLDR